MVLYVQSNCHKSTQNTINICAQIIFWSTFTLVAHLPSSSHPLLVVLYLSGAWSTLTHLSHWTALLWSRQLPISYLHPLSLIQPCCFLVWEIIGETGHCVPVCAFGSKIILFQFRYLGPKFTSRHIDVSSAEIVIYKCHLMSVHSTMWLNSFISDTVCRIIYTGYIIFLPHKIKISTCIAMKGTDLCKK